MRCVIICAGAFGELSFARKPDDFVICCDAGYDYAVKTGVTPNLVMGDFDSIESQLPTDIEVLRFPTKKDDTDAMLAIKEALARGYRELVLLYATGNRLDHTIANITALAYIAEQGASGRLVGVGEEVMLVRAGSITLTSRKGARLSVFCWGDVADGVTLAGVEYPLNGHTLTNRFPLGLGNYITEDECKISVAKGTLGIFLSKKE